MIRDYIASDGLDPDSPYPVPIRTVHSLVIRDLENLGYDRQTAGHRSRLTTIHALNTDDNGLRLVRTIRRALA